jgi:DNA-binding IclR family transcriptional regulator
VPRPERNPYLLKSVDRALELLELVARGSEPKTARQLAESTGLERTTAYRLLSTLEKRSFVERDPTTQTYSLGLGATGLANPAAHHAALIRKAHPTLERLTKETNQTVSLGVSQQWSAVVIDQIDPPNPIRLVNNVNVPLPLHCTSNGKVILARLNEAELDAYLRMPLERRTEHTITNAKRLRHEIDGVRAQGYAVAVDELVEGVSAVSVPIVRADELVGTITVSGLSHQLPAKQFGPLAKRLRKAAREIAGTVD